MRSCFVILSYDDLTLVFTLRAIYDAVCTERSLTLLNTRCSTHKKQQSPPSREHRSPANHHQNSTLTPNEELCPTIINTFSNSTSNFRLTNPKHCSFYIYNTYDQWVSIEPVTAISFSRPRYELSSDDLELKMSQECFQCSDWFVSNNILETSR